MNGDSARSSGQTARTILLGAACMGLLTGLVEGAGLLVFQEQGWLNWNMAQWGVNEEIIWISALFDLVLFLSVGLVWIMVSPILPRVPVLRLAAGSFALMMFLDWLLLSGRISHSGAFMLGLGLAVVFARWFKKRELTCVSIWRRSFPWVAMVSLAVLLLIEGRIWWKEHQALRQLSSPAGGAPNVLVVVMDALRADHLGCYGYSRSTSSNMDRLAKEGTLFENAYATAPWTLPSHASLLTGRYVFQHGAKSERLGENIPSIAEELQAHGYRTAAFSGNNFFFSRHQGLGRGFIRFEDFFASAADMAVRTVYGRKFNQFVLRKLGIEDIPGRKRAGAINESVLRWVDRDASKPFFVFINYFDTHDPYLPPEPYRHRFSRLKNPGGILNVFVLRHNPKMTPEQLQGEVDAYDGSIAYADENLGQLLNELEGRGMGKNTIVVATSDHGDLFGEHGLYLHHNSVYRNVVRVPLILRWPGHIPAGRRVTLPVTNAALPATVLELLGVNGDNKFPLTSLVRLSQESGEQIEWPAPITEMRQVAFEEFKMAPVYKGWLKSLATSQWYFILHQDGEAELYDWRQDPTEQKNLADLPEYRGVVSSLRAQLEQTLNGSPKAARAQ